MGDDFGFVVASLLGAVAGQCQEDVIEGGAAKSDVLRLDSGVIERSYRGRQSSGAVDGRDEESLPFRHQLATGHSRQGTCRGGPIVGHDVDLDHVAAHSILELVRSSLVYEAAPVDDTDTVCQPVGFVQVLRGEQERGPGNDELFDQIPKVEPAARVDSGCRLV